jgi:hypothetical protein
VGFSPWAYVSEAEELSPSTHSQDISFRNSDLISLE